MTRRKAEGSQWDRWAEELGIKEEAESTSSSQVSHPNLLEHELHPPDPAAGTTETTAADEREPAKPISRSAEVVAPDSRGHSASGQNPGRSASRHSERTEGRERTVSRQPSQRQSRHHAGAEESPARAGSHLRQVTAGHSGRSPDKPGPRHEQSLPKTGGAETASAATSAEGGTAEPGKVVKAPAPKGWCPPRKRIWPDFSHRSRKATDWNQLAAELGIVPAPGDLEQPQSETEPPAGIADELLENEKTEQSVAIGEYRRDALIGEEAKSEDEEREASAVAETGSPRGEWSTGEAVGGAVEVRKAQIVETEPTEIPRVPPSAFSEKRALTSRTAHEKKDLLGEVSLKASVTRVGEAETEPPGTAAASPSYPGVEEQDGRILGTSPSFPEVSSAEEVQAAPLLPGELLRSAGEIASQTEIKPASVPEAAHVDFAVPEQRVLITADTGLPEPPDGVGAEPPLELVAGERCSAVEGISSAELSASRPPEATWGSLRPDQSCAENFERALPEEVSVLPVTPSAAVEEPTTCYSPGPPEAGIQVAISEEMPPALIGPDAGAAVETEQDVTEPPSEVPSTEAVPEEELPPAFRAWFELFGEEPPELLSRREEKLVRELLGAPDTGPVAAEQEDATGLTGESSTRELVTAICQPGEAPGWVSSASVSWLGEEVSGVSVAGDESPELEKAEEAVSTREGRKAGRARRRRRRSARAAARQETSAETAAAVREQPGGKSAEALSDEEDHPGLIPPDAIPTWEETVGLIIVANMEHRARSQHSQGPYPRRPHRN